MEHFLALISLSIVLFASTNVDDVFVLLGFFAAPNFRFRQVVLGQFLGIGTLYGVSVLASLVSLVVRPAYIGMLGIAPILIGIKRLWDLCKGSDSKGEEAEQQVVAQRSNILVVALVTIANGGDNISIYTPLFATRTGYEVLAIGVVFAVMTAVWVAFAYWLTNHRTFGAPIRRYGHRVVPFVLMALGGFILYDAGTFTLLRSTHW